MIEYYLLLSTFIYFWKPGVIGLPGISINGAKGDLGEPGYQGAAGRPGTIKKKYFALIAMSFHNEVDAALNKQ